MTLVHPDPAASRAVLIGTSSYRHLPNLNAVTNNLQDLSAVLCDDSSWALAPEHCTVLENCDSADPVLEAVYDAATSARDTLLVYFAGHGLAGERGDGFYLGRPGTREGMSHTALSYSQLRHVIEENTRAQRHIMVLDACFSGRAIGTVMSPGQQVSAEEAEVAGGYILVSSPATSPSLAPPGERHTAFTGALLNLLRDGLPKGPEYLDLNSIYFHLRDVLDDLGAPRPQRRELNDTGHIALVRNAAWGTNARPAPPTEPSPDTNLETAPSTDGRGGIVHYQLAMQREAREETGPHSGPDVALPHVPNHHARLRASLLGTASWLLALVSCASAWTIGSAITIAIKADPGAATGKVLLFGVLGVLGYAVIWMTTGQAILVVGVAARLGWKANGVRWVWSWDHIGLRSAVLSGSGEAAFFVAWVLSIGVLLISPLAALVLRPELVIGGPWLADALGLLPGTG
ncbi:caspase, EACC1-associated type [Streptomyces sp. WAC01526]|uniref:caspase family protein n=1 Tax=Streptomyces sp. WAC01526 TaxID=2588709 RepID=UPI00165257BE|nr:caspase family protein [Streptomyces sp. WAC01526]